MGSAKRRRLGSRRIRDLAIESSPSFTAVVLNIGNVIVETKFALLEISEDLAGAAIKEDFGGY